MALLVRSEQVRIPADNTEMEGALSLPESSIGVVLFAACSSGQRVSPPSDYVASVLRSAHLGTLWVELLSRGETHDSRLRSDVARLAERLRIACEWLRQREATADLSIGLYGGSHCAAAALQLAANNRCGIAAIVSRGGHPELASPLSLGKIAVPTLLIVGGLDDDAVRMNRVAYAALRCKKRLEVIPGATHAFEEAGNQEVIARLARGWFLQHVHSRLG